MRKFFIFTLGCFGPLVVFLPLLVPMLLSIAFINALPTGVTRYDYGGLMSTLIMLTAFVAVPAIVFFVFRATHVLLIRWIFLYAANNLLTLMCFYPILIAFGDISQSHVEGSVTSVQLRNQAHETILFLLLGAQLLIVPCSLFQCKSLWKEI